MDIFHNPTHTICGQGNAYHDSNVYIYSGQINYKQTNLKVICFYIPNDWSLIILGGYLS